ncbi:MAG: hypothetical protein EBU05_06360 [Chitinophagia bacterium]|jgi:hypothetical protein|nr:hypothetical protein [Chitinophagia bacterium]
MKKILLFSLLGFSLNAFAQDPDDVLKYSWFAPHGTPRSNALGGAMGSLGGDMSSSHINPAGLGFYKSSEFLLTSKFSNKTNSIDYFKTNTSVTSNNINIGNLGIVLADGRKKNNWSSTAFSISYTQIADYNNHYGLSGKNTYSSFTEKFADQLYDNQASLTDAQQNFIYGSSLAIQSKLVNPIFDANGNITDYRTTIPIGALNQKNDVDTKGGYNELAFGWGGNIEDKLYLGASINLPMINFSKTNYFGETGYFDFYEESSSKGFGLGAKFGLIYKAEPFLRFGFTYHTPQIISFRDAINAEMYSNALPNGLSSGDLINNFKGNLYPTSYDYTMATPAKAIVSSSYFFANPNKPTQPLGFISADIEWVKYAGTRFYSNDNNQEVVSYYNDLNYVIKNTYKNNFNIKIGSEVKLNGNWMARAGTAFYGSPYKDGGFKASQFVLSGGIGYRTEKHFIDLTIMNTMVKDAIFPYRLTEKSSYYADYKGNNLMFNIGYGIRF